jgi:hypothetical protein
VGAAKRGEGWDALERFQPDCAVDPGRFARGTALTVVPIQQYGQFRLAISVMSDVNEFFGKPGKYLIYMPG